MTEDLKRRLILRWRERDDDASSARAVPLGACGYTIDVLMSWVADMIADAQHLGALEFAQAPILCAPGPDFSALCGAEATTIAVTAAEANCNLCESLRRTSSAELTSRNYVRALAATYIAADPDCPANPDGSGEWSIDDVADAVRELAEERDVYAAKVRELSLVTVSNPDHFELPATFPPGLISGLDAIGVTQDQARALRDSIRGNSTHSRDSHAFWDSLSSHLHAESIEPRPKPPALSDWAKVCQALDLPASDTTAEQIVESVKRLQLELKRDMNQLCSAVGLVEGCSATAIEEHVLALYLEISEAKHILAPYCAEADPMRVDLGGVVSMLVNEVLEPRQVQREQADERTRLHNPDQNRWVYYEGEAGFTELDAYNPGDNITYWNRPLVFIERRWTGARRSSGERACLFSLGAATWTPPKTTQ